MMRRLGAGTATVAALVLAAPVVPAAAQANGDPELATALARPALVVVEVHWQGWVRDQRTGEVFGGAQGFPATGACTGFAVHAGGQLVTAGSCLDPAAALFARAAQDLADVGRAGDVDQAVAELAEHAVAEGPTDGSPVPRRVIVHRGVFFDGDVGDDALPAEVVDLDGEAGVALLSVERGRMPVLELASGEGAAGTPVLAIGFPGTPERIGDPTGEPRVAEAELGGDAAGGYEVAADLAADLGPGEVAGLGGGPVVDHTGRVVGLLSAGPGGEEPAPVTPAASIREVLERNDVAYGPGPIDRNFRTGLELLRAGESADAAAYFAAVLDASPAHQQAKELQRQAGGSSGGGGGLSPLVAWAIILAVVAVLAAAAAALMFLLRLGGPVEPSETPR